MKEHRNWLIALTLSFLILAGAVVYYANQNTPATESPEYLELERDYESVRRSIDDHLGCMDFGIEFESCRQRLYE